MATRDRVLRRSGEEEGLGKARTDLLGAFAVVERVAQVIDAVPASRGCAGAGVSKAKVGLLGAIDVAARVVTALDEAVDPAGEDPGQQDGPMEQMPPVRCHVQARIIPTGALARDARGRR